MKRVFVIGLILAMGGVQAELTGDADREAVEVSRPFRVVSSNSHQGILDFQLNDYHTETVLRDGKVYIRLRAPSSGRIGEIGKPELPVHSTLYAVEAGYNYTVSVEILESEILPDVLVLPEQLDEYDAPGEVVQLEMDDKFYASSGVFPEEHAWLSEPMSFREMTVVQLNIAPFRYHAGTRTVEVIRRANVVLQQGQAMSDGPGNSRQVPLSRSAAFEPLYESFVVNYTQVERVDVPYQTPSILYVLPTNSSVNGPLQPLLNWKHRSGFEVHTVTLTETGTSNSSLRSWLQNMYNTWDDPPEFVALVGDVGGTFNIPKFNETYSAYNGDTDHPYSQLDGDDLLPEVLIGRISVSSTTQLATVVNKIVNYESNPYLAEHDWYTRALLVGDTSPSGISCRFTNEYIDELSRAYGFGTNIEIYSASPSPSQMQNALNSGVSYFNYRGWIGVSGFGGSQINALTNGYKLSFATIITCGTGSFGGTAITEELIRAGTPTQPKGSIAAIGTATSGTHTMFNNAVDMGIYEGIFVHGIRSAGGALMFGKLHLYKTYPSNPSSYVSIFTMWNNLMGDPSTQLWTEVPELLNVSAPANLVNGTNFVNVDVRDEEYIPITDARVILVRGDESFETRLTDESGQATVPVSYSTPGVVKLTVTKPGYAPFLADLAVLTPEVAVNLDTAPVTIDDDTEGISNGNGDGLINPGEIIEVALSLFNYGSQSAEDVTAVMTSVNEKASIVQGTGIYGTILPGTPAVPSTPFAFQINSTDLNGDEILLQLDITAGGESWEGLYHPLVVGAYPNVEIVQIDDNNNGIFDPGETVNLILGIRNTGEIPITGLTGTLSFSGNVIEFLDDNATWSPLLPGYIIYNSTDPFTVMSNEDLIPGSRFALSLSLAADGGFQYNDVVGIQVGEASVMDPLGPDEYGYYMFDSGDLTYNLAPFYDWIEIDPADGGNGTQLSIYDTGDNQDDVITVGLPFPFIFYGITYEQISICSNGWLALGPTEQGSFRNYHVPAAGGPGAMIAAYWDDLTTTANGKIFNWYDPESHTYVVQWDGVRSFFNNDVQTFQAILYDPAYYITPTGDGEILLQYRVFNNTNYGDYSWSQIHGNYATIGIENHLGNVGLEYTFNNQYPPAAMMLGNETAVFITTRGAIITNQGDVNQDGELNVLDIILIVNHILNNQPLDPLGAYLADMNEDGVVNVLDIVILVGTILET